MSRPVHIPLSYCCSVHIPLSYCSFVPSRRRHHAPQATFVHFCLIVLSKSHPFSYRLLTPAGGMMPWQPEPVSALSACSVLFLLLPARAQTHRITYQAPLDVLFLAVSALPQTAMMPVSHPMRSGQVLPVAPTGSEPLPHDQVDEMVKRFYARHQVLWQAPPLQHSDANECYSPTRMPASTFQDAADSGSLQRQAAVHLNVASLLSAFAFSALAAESLSGGDGVVDQLIFVNLSLATVLLWGTVYHFLNIETALGTKGGARYWHAYSAKLGVSCVAFHQGTFLLGASFPLWAYRKFALQPCFYAALAIAAGWVLYDLGVNLPSHNELNQLLAHAELGIDAEQHLRARPLAPWRLHTWLPAAWKRMHDDARAPLCELA